MRYTPLFVLVVSIAAACTTSEELGSRPEAGTSADDGGSDDSGLASTESGTASDGGMGTDAAVDIDAAGWTPKQLNGLSLWLDDTVGIIPDPTQPGRVKRWLDQSGLGNTAESASGNGVDTAPALNPAAVGGRDAVDCDRSTYFNIPSVDSLKFGTGDFGIVMVAKPSAPGSLLTKLTQNGVAFAVSPEGTLSLRTAGPGGASVLLAGTPLTKFSVFVARGPALKIQVGANSATGPTSTADLTGDNVGMLVCRSGTSLKISVAEVIVVKGTLSDADLAKTLGYLNAKFGL